MSDIHAQWRQTSISVGEDAHISLRYSVVPSTSIRVRLKFIYPHRRRWFGTYPPKRFEYLPSHRRVQASGGTPASSSANRMSCLLSSSRSWSSRWLSRRCLWAASPTASSRKLPPTRGDLVTKSTRSSCISALRIFRERVRPPCPMVPFSYSALKD